MGMKRRRYVNEENNVKQRRGADALSTIGYGGIQAHSAADQRPVAPQNWLYRYAHCRHPRNTLVRIRKMAKYKFASCSVLVSLLLSFYGKQKEKIKEES